MAIAIPMMVFDAFIELNHLPAEGTALLLLVRHLSTKLFDRLEYAIDDRLLFRRFLIYNSDDLQCDRLAVRRFSRSGADAPNRGRYERGKRRAKRRWRPTRD